MNNNLTKKMTYTGIMTALVFLGTFMIKLPLPYTGGYIHLGDSMVFISGIILGKKRGAFAAGIGSALADVVAGYIYWSLPTLIIKATMAWIIGYVYTKRNNFKTVSVLTMSYIIMWSIFHVIMRTILNSNLNYEKIITLLDNPKITSKNQLITAINNLELKLMIALIVLPLLISMLLFISNKFHKTNITLSSLIGFVIAGSFMVVMYYLTEYILYGNYIIPIFAIPMNILQFLSGLIIAITLLPFIRKSINE